MRRSLWKRLRHPVRQQAAWSDLRKRVAVVTAGVLATAAAVVLVPTMSADASGTTLQVTNLQHSCGGAGFSGQVDATGLTEGDQYNNQAYLNDPNYPDSFNASFTAIGTTFSATQTFRNPFGSESVPPDTATGVTFDLFDVTAGGTVVATYTTTLPACGGTTAVAPVGTDDSFFVAYNTPTDLVVLANDTSPDNGTLQVCNLSTPSHGTASVNPDQTVHYVPSTGYSGSDAFTYQPCENGIDGDVTNATITVGTPPQETPPTVSAGPDMHIVRDVLAQLNGSANDADGDALVRSWTVNSKSCSFGSPDQPVTTITCAKPGKYVATLTANDGNNPPVSDSANVWVKNKA